MTTLVERDLEVFWHPCSQMRDHHDFPPMEVVAARGARLTLADGRQILDAISSWWCKSLGHGHAGVRSRVQAQLARFEHVITANTTHAGLVELCERLLLMANGAPRAAWGPRVATRTPRASAPTTGSTAADGDFPTPGHFGKVFLADNGSTAIEVSLKMALQAQAQRGQSGRTRFAALSGGYHGETVGALSVGDLGLYSDPYRLLMFPVMKIGPVPYRTGPDDPAWLDAGEEWSTMKGQLSRAADGLAAIVYEPVLQAAGGMHFYSPDLLIKLRHFASEHGIYLIADEIAAGMGRLGKMLAGEWAVDSPAHAGGPRRDALPDFAVFSKGLTAGFLPLSAVLTTDEIYRQFDGAWADGRAFLHSNTYTGNALGIAAALGALDAYSTEGILDQVALNGPRLRAMISTMAERLGTLTRVRGLGMVAAADLTAPGGGALDPAARTGTRVFREAVKRGALLRPLGDTMYVFPPLNSTHAELDEMVEILGASVTAVSGSSAGVR